MGQKCPITERRATIPGASPSVVATPRTRGQSGVKEVGVSAAPLLPSHTWGPGLGLRPWHSARRPPSCPFSAPCTGGTRAWRANQGSFSSFPAPSTHRGCRGEVGTLCRFPPGCRADHSEARVRPTPASARSTRFSRSVLGNGRDFSEDLTLTLTLTLVEAQRGGQAGCPGPCPVSRRWSLLAGHLAGQVCPADPGKAVSSRDAGPVS